MDHQLFLVWFECHLQITYRREYVLCSRWISALGRVMRSIYAHMVSVGLLAPAVFVNLPERGSGLESFCCELLSEVEVRDHSWASTATDSGIIRSQGESTSNVCETTAIFSNIVCKSADSNTAASNFSSSSVCSMISHPIHWKCQLSVLIVSDILLKGRRQSLSALNRVRIL